MHGEEFCRLKLYLEILLLFEGVKEHMVHVTVIWLFLDFHKLFTRSQGSSCWVGWKVAIVKESKEWEEIIYFHSGQKWEADEFEKDYI